MITATIGMPQLYNQYTFMQQLTSIVSVPLIIFLLVAIEALAIVVMMSRSIDDTIQDAVMDADSYSDYGGYDDE